MSEITVTPAQQIRLNLLTNLNYDTAAAADAIQFVGDDPLKYQLFVNQLSRVTTEIGLWPEPRKLLKHRKKPCFCL